MQAPSQIDDGKLALQSADELSLEMLDALDAQQARCLCDIELAAARRQRVA